MRAMIVYATSDLHGALPEIEPCDLLIIGGDICPDFPVGKKGSLKKGVYRQRQWLDTTFRQWLEEIPAVHVVGIAGNHDFVFENSFTIPMRPMRWEYLRDSEIEVEGLRIYGTPWVPNLVNWAFYGDFDWLGNRWAKIPSEVDVLISHGPPHGHGDRVRSGMAVGCEQLHDRIDEIKPKVVITGHIHEGHGIHRFKQQDETTIYNVALMDEVYVPTHEPTRIEEF